MTIPIKEYPNNRLRQFFLFSIYPLSYIFYNAEFFLLIFLATTFITQSLTPLKEALYFVKWGFLILFILVEYLFLRTMEIKAPKFQWRFPAFVYILIGFIIYISFTSLFSISIADSILKTITLTLLLILTLIVLPYYAKVYDKKETIINAIYYLCILFLIINFFAIFFSPTAYTTWVKRLRGTFENPNTLGMFCFVSFPIILYKFRTSVTFLQKAAKILFLLILLTLVTLSFSRASILAIGICAAVYLFYFHKKIFISAFILFLIVCVVVLLTPILLELLRLADDPLSLRDQLWDIGIQAWNGHKLFGTGYGTATVITDNPYAIISRGLTDYLQGKHLHNIYVEVLVETGIIGITIFLSIMIALIYEILKKVRNSSNNDRTLSICYMGMLFALVIQSFFESFMLSAGNASTIIFWILTGLILQNLVPGETGKA